jgi:predicted MFS family arabinose efflux permease
VLFVNVPVGIAAAALAPRLLPESRNEGHRHFDFAGAVSITAGLSLLVYTLVDAESAGWGSTQTLGLGAVALALIASFYAIERRSKAPLMPFPGIFRIRTITGINVSAVLIAAALFSMFFFISLYMQQVLGFSALEAGLAYLPLAVGIIIAAGATAGFVTRFGFKPVLVAGLVVTAAGLVWFSQVSADGSYVSDILFPSLLAAIGLGLAFVSMTVAAVSGVEAHEAGLASGLINTSQQIGGALGLAILATIANSQTNDAFAGGASQAIALTEGFKSAFAAGAGLAIAGAILAMILVSGRASREHAEAARRGELDPAPAVA